MDKSCGHEGSEELVSQHIAVVSKGKGRAAVKVYKLVAIAVRVIGGCLRCRPPRLDFRNLFPKLDGDLITSRQRTLKARGERRRKAKAAGKSMPPPDYAFHTRRRLERPSVEQLERREV